MAKRAAKTTDKAESPDGDDGGLARRHLAWGWWSLAAFTMLGLVLEAAHGLKLGWYLDVSSATRRLSFTLGHAHGTLLGLVNIAFALSLDKARLSATAAARASFALRAVTVLMPLGFILGGAVVYGGDPGLAIEYTMNLFLFHWLMILGLLSFTELDELRRLVARIRRARP